MCPSAVIKILGKFYYIITMFLKDRFIFHIPKEILIHKREGNVECSTSFLLVSMLQDFTLC